MRIIRGAVYRSFGLRILAIRPFGRFRFYSDLDSVYLIAAEFLGGEISSLASMQGKVFLDVGAHFGYVSAKIASSADPSSRIIAIEPNPRNYSVLRSNVELNNFTSVKPFRFAIANFTGTSRMQAPDGVSTRFKVTHDSNESDSSIEVECYLLPDVFKRLGLDRVDFAKLDIEGLELDVLRSAFPKLANKIDRLDIEVHNAPDLPLLENLLMSNGFDIEVCSNGVLSRSYRIFARKVSSQDN